MSLSVCLSVCLSACLSVCLSVCLSACLSFSHCYLEHELARKRVNSGRSYGLEIPTRFRLYGPEKATQWLETRLTKIEEQLKESVNYYLK